MRQYRPNDNATEARVRGLNDPISKLSKFTTSKHHTMGSMRGSTPAWAEKTIHRSSKNYRRLTGRYRILPHFLLIGAQKSGTTSLYYYLSQHAQIVPPFTKEINFFDGGRRYDADKFEKGEIWYRSHFPLQWSVHASQLTFEASTSYMFNPLVARRIHNLIPDAKLIAILRNPVERAVSHYFHSKRKGYEALPIMAAFQAEDEKLRPVLARKDYKSLIFRENSYKRRSLYYEQLKIYLRYFAMDNILVLKSEDLFNNPAATLQRVFHFLGLDTKSCIKNLTPRNVGSNRTQIDPHIYEYLENYFRPHNHDLYELIGQDLGWEKKQ
jgi:hypothetical protein